MTLDANALIAIVRQSPGWETLVTRALEADEPRVAATALAEAGMLLAAQDDLFPTLALSEIVHTLKLTVVPFTERDWMEAVKDYHRRRRSATVQPRMGECLTAAVALRTGNPVVRIAEQ